MRGFQPWIKIRPCKLRRWVLLGALAYLRIRKALSWSVSDLLRIIDRITAAGASFRSLTEPIDTGTPVGRMMLQLLGAFAEFERSVIRERCAAGRAAALARGVRIGRPPVIDVSRLPAMHAQGLTASQMAAVFGVERSSVAHWLSRLGLVRWRRPDLRKT